MDQVFFETENLAKQRFPNFEPAEKLESCEHNGHRYRKAGTASTHHGIGWQLIKLVQTVAIGILSLFVRSYRERVGSLWNAATTGSEQHSICIKYLPGEELSLKISETQKKMFREIPLKTAIESFLKTASNEEVIELVRQSDGDGSVLTEGKDRKIFFPYIAELATPNLIPAFLSGAGQDANKLGLLFSTMPLSENLPAFLKGITPEQMNLLFHREYPDLWTRILPLFSLSSTTTLRPEFVEACQTALKQHIDTEIGCLRLTHTCAHNHLLDGLYTLLGPCESLSKFLNKFSDEVKDSNDIMLIAEKVFSQKVNEIPEHLLCSTAKLIFGYRWPARAELDSDQKLRLNELIRNSFSNSNLEALETSYLLKIFDTLSRSGIKNIPHCFESLSGEKLQSCVREVANNDLKTYSLLYLIKNNVSDQTERERLFEAFFSALTDEQFTYYLKHYNTSEFDHLLLEGCSKSLTDDSHKNKLFKMAESIVNDNNGVENRLSDLMRTSNTEQKYQILSWLPSNVTPYAVETFVDDDAKLNDFFNHPRLVMNCLYGLLNNIRGSFFITEKALNLCQPLLDKLKNKILEKGKKDKIINGSGFNPLNYNMINGVHYDHHIVVDFLNK